MPGVSKQSWKSLVPEPDWVEDIHHRNGNTQDIINVLLSAFKYNNFQGAREMKDVSKALTGKNDLETLYNTWLFVKSNITYKTDDRGKEKIKSPALLFHYGVGDCKSFSLMVASILMNVPGIKVWFRFTAYKKNADFEHVYVIARSSQIKKEIILDSTIKEFNFEHPYVKKIDYKLTEISHLHGAPSILRKARPSIAEAFKDGPRKVVSPKIDISKYSQGELNLQLSKANLLIKLNYYGDPSGNFSKAIGLIDNAIKGGLHNFNLGTKVFDEALYPIIDAIFKAKDRHILELTNLQEAKNEAGISGSNIHFPISQEELGICIKKLNLSSSSGNIFTKDWVEWSGDKYRLNDSLLECIKTGVLRTWAKNNIFESENFRKGSHSLLYEFINSSNEGWLNARGTTKEIIHKSYTEAFSNVSGLDKANVRLYVKNGIAYTSGLNNLTTLEPEFSIESLSKGNQYKGQPGIGIDPATVATVIKILGAAIVAIKAAIKSAGPTAESNLSAYAKGLLGDSTQAKIDDFKENINNAENLNSIVPLAAGGLALGYLIFNK